MLIAKNKGLYRTNGAEIYVHIVIMHFTFKKIHSEFNFLLMCGAIFTLLNGFFIACCTVVLPSDSSAVDLALALFLPKESNATVL